MKRLLPAAAIAALALACLSGIKLRADPQVPDHTLLWDWSPDADNPASNVLFIVRSSQDLLQSPTNWPVVAIVPTNAYAFTASQPKAFFHVQSSNTLSHLVSD